MNEQDRKIQELLKDSFDSPAPPTDFTLNVMEEVNKRVERKEAKGFEYKPVISKRGRALVGGIFLTLVVVGLVGEEGNVSFPLVQLPDLQYDIPVFQSQYVLVAFLSIFSLLIVDRLIKKLKLV